MSITIFWVGTVDFKGSFSGYAQFDSGFPMRVQYQLLFETAMLLSQKLYPICKKRKIIETFFKRQKTFVIFPIFQRVLKFSSKNLNNNNNNQYARKRRIPSR